ncbi:adhesion G protein-coupled receptor E2-like [Betta splendens]|uniref:Adhesion G protein-coupled receptor E2-like n=1 Tax=Betta splendens TaxID=158456 RepID=A0A8M1HH78_BETSP|nr:adhesion G protein-coupled receptor E2-like [Betta splendens]
MVITNIYSPIFLVFVGSLFFCGLCDFPPGSCDGYTNIDEPWRNFLFRSSSFPGYPKNDGGLVGNWLRFSGIGGDTVVPTCYTGPVGGAQYAIHVPLTYPTVENQTVTGTAYGDVGACNYYSIKMNVILCPGSFYIYNASNHPYTNMGYVTYHLHCGPNSCGPLAQCDTSGGCACVAGYQMPQKALPTPQSYGCTDIDECVTTPGICGTYENCVNTIGSYTCSCQTGFIATNPKLPSGPSNACIDVDECLASICGPGTCTNTIGSFLCNCDVGYYFSHSAVPACQDIDECLNATICGPYSACTNTAGSFYCLCLSGFEPTTAALAPGLSNVCIDIIECVQYNDICGPNSNCTNYIGSYNCTCDHGYRVWVPDVISSANNPCKDIDECTETPGICGLNTICTNVPGTYYCSCPGGYYPSTGILWTVGVTYCQNLRSVLDDITPPQGETKQSVFLGNMEGQLINNSNIQLPGATVVNSLSASLSAVGVGPYATSSDVSSAGDGQTGSQILGLAGRLVSMMLQPGQNQTKTTVSCSTVELSLRTIKPGSHNDYGNNLTANDNIMEINMKSLAKNNNGSASVAFMTLTGMESLLSHQYFVTENITEMYSDIITAVLPSVNNTNLTEPVNFTIQHKKTQTDGDGMVTCVYWKDNTETDPSDNAMAWSVDGCWVSFTNDNYTVCSCSHLSTFALILQIAEPQPADNFLDLLNQMCVIVGLFFFGLSILTFLLCSWNPKINNTARLHLCITTASYQLLMLWDSKYVDQPLACKVLAGLLHFLITASFVWMLLEALQLYLLVRRLSKVQVIQRDGLPRPLLYMVGYGVPFVVVGVSALVYSDGYGATAAKACWLTTNRNFNWAVTGPVIAVLGMNCVLFGSTLWSLRPTLASMKSDVSQSKDTRLILFKILAQFVILGCTWILGFYQSNLFFKVVFIVLNSQQGTFLYVVHCLLNKEVREEYIKWLTCSFKSSEGGSVKDVPSVSEDLDKAEERKVQ